MKYDLKLQDESGRDLEVVQEIPGKGDKFATVILVPGFGVDLHEFGFYDDLSRALVRNGFQVFRFSFAGTGKSTGNFQEMTIQDQVAQLKFIIEYVMQDRFTVSDQIGIMAHAFGASVAIAASPLPEIATYVFTGTSAYPAESLSKHFKRQRGYEPEGVSKMERIDKSITKIDSSFWRSSQRINLVGKIKTITQPVLFIHGSMDRKIKLQDALVLYHAVGESKKFHTVEKADHAFTGKFRRPVLNLIVEWFEEELHLFS